MSPQSVPASSPQERTTEQEQAWLGDTNQTDNVTGFDASYEQRMAALQQSAAERSTRPPLMQGVQDQKRAAFYEGMREYNAKFREPYPLHGGAANNHNPFDPNRLYDNAVNGTHAFSDGGSSYNPPALAQFYTNHRKDVLETQIAPEIQAALQRAERTGTGIDFGTVRGYLGHLAPGEAEIINRRLREIGPYSLDDLGTYSEGSSGFATALAQGFDAQAIAKDLATIIHNPKLSDEQKKEDCQNILKRVVDPRQWALVCDAYRIHSSPARIVSDQLLILLEADEPDAALICKLLNGRSEEECQQIQALFEEGYKKLHPEAALRDVTLQDIIAQKFANPPEAFTEWSSKEQDHEQITKKLRGFDADRIADEAYECITGWQGITEGADNEAGLLRALEGLSREQTKEVEAAYRRKGYGDLREQITSDLSERDLARALNALDGKSVVTYPNNTLRQDLQSIGFTPDFSEIKTSFAYGSDVTTKIDPLFKALHPLQGEPNGAKVIQILNEVTSPQEMGRLILAYDSTHPGESLVHAVSTRLQGQEREEAIRALSGADTFEKIQVVRDAQKIREDLRVLEKYQSASVEAIEFLRAEFKKKFGVELVDYVKNTVKNDPQKQDYSRQLYLTILAAPEAKELNKIIIAAERQVAKGQPADLSAACKMLALGQSEDCLALSMAQAMRYPDHQLFLIEKSIPKVITPDNAATLQHKIREEVAKVVLTVSRMDLESVNKTIETVSKDSVDVEGLASILRDKSPKERIALAQLYSYVENTDKNFKQVLLAKYHEGKLSQENTFRIFKLIDGLDLWARAEALHKKIEEAKDNPEALTEIGDMIAQFSLKDGPSVENQQLAKLYQEQYGTNPLTDIMKLRGGDSKIDDHIIELAWDFSVAVYGEEAAVLANDFAAAFKKPNTEDELIAASDGKSFETCAGAEEIYDAVFAAPVPGTSNLRLAITEYMGYAAAQDLLGKLPTDKLIEFVRKNRDLQSEVLAAIDDEQREEVRELARAERAKRTKPSTTPVTPTPSTPSADPGSSASPAPAAPATPAPATAPTDPTTTAGSTTTAPSTSTLTMSQKEIDAAADHIHRAMKGFGATASWVLETLETVSYADRLAIETSFNKRHADHWGGLDTLEEDPSLGCMRAAFKDQFEGSTQLRILMSLNPNFDAKDHAILAHDALRDRHGRHDNANFLSAFKDLLPEQRDAVIKEYDRLYKENDGNNSFKADLKEYISREQRDEVLDAIYGFDATRASRHLLEGKSSFGPIYLYEKQLGILKDATPEQIKEIDAKLPGVIKAEISWWKNPPGLLEYVMKAGLRDEKLLAKIASALDQTDTMTPKYLAEACKLYDARSATVRGESQFKAELKKALENKNQAEREAFDKVFCRLFGKEFATANGKDVDLHQIVRARFNGKDRIELLDLLDKPDPQQPPATTH